MSQLVATDSYEKIVDAKLRAESVFAKLFNTKHDGNPVAGAVKIPVRAEATVGTYNIANGGTLTNPTTSYTAMVCDKDKYVNELIDGFVAAAVSDNMVAERIDSAGFALANDVDVALGALCKDSGTVLSNTTALTTSTVYDAIIDAVQQAKTAKAHARDMWIVVDTITYGLLLKCDEFIGAAASTADLGAGYVGKLGGIPVYESVNMPSNTEFIVGNNVWCHYVAEWMVKPAVKDLADGAHIGSSAVQGRLVSGYTITQATTVVVKTKN